ncbi:MAG: hypothetical protein IGBAC_0434 [Ignavibacteriae bacterium]|nr:MAG: hypothetical protein IGBAC_0434 [Ignavibacteriota bacterium]
MPYTYDELSKMTVNELRKIADTIEHDDLKGHSTMHKDKLLPILCKVLGVDIAAHHRAALSNKGKIKAEIRQLKVERDQAIAAKDKEKLHAVRKRIHQLKKILRRAIV